jgi:hypothetical protein
MKVRAAIAAAVLAVTLTIPANALAYRTWFEFARQSNIASTLTMVWQYGTGYNGTQTWRAGSGVSTDACWIGHGWLPTGYYDLWGHWDNFSGKIAGRVFYLQNKPCWNGTWRTELFVHSEETGCNQMVRKSLECEAANPWHQPMTSTHVSQMRASAPRRRSPSSSTSTRWRAASGPSKPASRSVR